MAVTVVGKNYTQISSCDSAAAGGTWGGSPVVYPDFRKQGAASIGDVLKSSGDNDWTFTPSASVDLSGEKHVRIWLALTQGGLINVKASGGIQFYASDGSNTGYWYIGGSDTYPGGWYNFVCKVSRAVDAGTKPTSMNAITSMGIRINLTAGGKNVDNTWVDNLIICDGLTAYGHDGGGYFDFEDIYAVDNTASTLTGGWGVIRKIGGAYFLTGSIEFGDTTATAICKFQAKQSVVIFEDRDDDISSSLCNFSVVDNGTETTEFILGSKSGTAGIEGCTIRVADVTQVNKFSINATGANVDNFKLYGSTFLDAGDMYFPANATDVEVLNCNFESCGEIIPNTAVVKSCNVISSNDRGLRISSLTHNVDYTNFISCKHGVHIDLNGTVEFDHMVFSGCATDLDCSATGGWLDVGAVDSNPNSYDTDGVTVNIINSVYLTVNVEDENGSPITSAQTAIYTNSATNLMNEDTDGTGQAQTTYNYGGDKNVTIRIRKNSPGAQRYVNYTTSALIESGGLTTTAVMQEDPVATSV